MTSSKLSLIVPFYNENNIFKNYLVLNDYLSKNIPNYEIIFVSDGSDKKYLVKLITESKRNKKIKIIQYKNNKGRGYAVKEAFKKVTGEFAIYIDADLEISHTYILPLYKKLQKADVVLTSKFHSQSHVNSPLYRRLPSLFFNFFVRSILGSKIKDHQIGLKGFRTKAIKNIISYIKEDKWLFDVELLYLLQKKKVKILEIPVTFTYGYGKIRKSFVIDSLKLFPIVFLIKLRHSRIK